MSGSGDPRFRFSINLFGAPALSVKEFANYQQDLIIGASLQMSAPLGQYDNSKLLNLGNNRWSFRPELGISKAWGPWTVEVAPALHFSPTILISTTGARSHRLRFIWFEDTSFTILNLAFGSHWMALTLRAVAPP